MKTKKKEQEVNAAIQNICREWRRITRTMESRRRRCNGFLEVDESENKEERLGSKHDNTE